MIVTGWPVPLKKLSSNSCEKTTNERVAHWELKSPQKAIIGSTSVGEAAVSWSMWRASLLCEGHIATRDLSQWLGQADGLLREQKTDWKRLLDAGAT